jgi:hypothetical protein
MQDDIYEIYWKASKQRIKTAELKNSLPVERTRSSRRQTLLSIHQLKYAPNKTQFVTSVKLLCVSAPECHPQGVF